MGQALSQCVCMTHWYVVCAMSQRAQLGYELSGTLDSDRHQSNTHQHTHIHIHRASALTTVPRYQAHTAGVLSQLVFLLRLT